MVSGSIALAADNDSTITQNGVTQRISFAPGATSAQVSGSVSGTSTDTYLLTAFAGQRMQIQVSSPSGNAYLTVVSPGGSPLARAQNGVQSFDQVLPESGDYTLEVSAPSGTPTTPYILAVSVVYLQTPTGGTRRISFAPGATSAQVSGSMSGASTDTYLLTAFAGQRMQIYVSGSPYNAYLTVVSPGGSPLARAQNYVQNFDQTLPETGDYRLEVSAPSGTPTTNYILTVSVVYQQSQPSPTPQRISFPANGTYAQASGQVSGSTINNFVLNAHAGQWMLVGLSSPNVYLSVISPSGSPLARAQNGTQSFAQTLPETGDYRLEISAPSGTPATDYFLIVSVTNSQSTSQRLSFPQNATSAQISGQVSGSFTNTYLVNAHAGQRMQVTVSSPSFNVYLSVISPSGSPLARAQNGTQTFDQTLSESGDYQLEVSAPAGTSQTTYWLSIGITDGQSSGTTQRITFAPGGISAQVSGQVDGSTLNTYLLNARAGQRMQIWVWSSTASAYLTIVSPGGSPLARAQNGTQSFDQTIPENGDYTISGLVAIGNTADQLLADGGRHGLTCPASRRHRAMPPRFDLLDTHFIFVNPARYAICPIARLLRLRNMPRMCYTASGASSYLDAFHRTLWHKLILAVHNKD